MKNRTLTVLPLALLAGLTTSVSHAQSVSGDTPSLSETVVTATRTATRASALTSEVVVVDRETIERSAGRTLLEVLARTASVQITSNGGRGRTSSVSIRGAESRHTLLLIDGMRYGSATAGTPSWENIPVEMIERIEVLKGPASAIYGSDAAGGVIQIFTRRGMQGFFPSASVTLGSKGHHEVTAGLRGGKGDLSYSLDVQDLGEKGFSATNPSVPFGNHNPDRDGFEQSSVSGSLDWRFARDWTFGINALQSDGEVQFDDGPGADTRSRLRSTNLGLKAEGKVLPGWTTRLSYGNSLDRTDAVESASPWNVPGLFETTQDQWTWQNEVATPLGLVVAGFEHLEQSVESSTAYVVTKRRVRSVFAGITGSAGAHAWQLNVRGDENSQFGNNSTSYVGYGYQFHPQWRAHGSYGTSFVAPSFNQLYWPGFGNAALEPEEGKNAELGVTWTEGVHSVKLVHFNNRIRGYITSGTLPSNVPRVRIDGWTLGYEGQWRALSLRASVDALDPRNEQTGLRLQRRAKSQINLGADYTSGPWTFGGSLLQVGKRFDDGANAVPLGAYTTVDLSARYKLAKDWSLQATVNNLTDKRYETALGYNQPGRTAYLTLRWQPR